MLNPTVVYWYLTHSWRKLSSRLNSLKTQALFAVLFVQVVFYAHPIMNFISMDIFVKEKDIALVWDQMSSLVTKAAVKLRKIDAIYSAAMKGCCWCNKKNLKNWLSQDKHKYVYLMSRVNLLLSSHQAIFLLSNKFLDIMCMLKPHMLWSFERFWQLILQLLVSHTALFWSWYTLQHRNTKKMINNTT